MKRGEIYYADLSPTVGSEQGGNRPVVVVQNNIGNRYSPTVIIAPLTTRVKNPLKTHVHVGAGEGIESESTILLEQVRAIDRDRIQGFVCCLNAEIMKKVDKALRISLEIRNAKQE